MDFAFLFKPGYLPPSLINIFKELNEDLGVAIPSHGNLSAWATQGVFLLNASLTVRAGEPMSHSKIGWAQFTDNVIKKISTEKTKVVFLLWENLLRRRKH
jgi:uracil-DNA glycosylase